MWSRFLGRHIRIPAGVGRRWGWGGVRRSFRVRCLLLRWSANPPPPPSTVERVWLCSNLPLLLRKASSWQAGVCLCCESVGWWPSLRHWHLHVTKWWSREVLWHSFTPELFPQCNKLSYALPFCSKMFAGPLVWRTLTSGQEFQGCPV